MKRKAKKAKEKQTASGGGLRLVVVDSFWLLEGRFASFNVDELAREGINVPVGDGHTCLPDAVHTLMVDAEPNLRTKQQEVRAALHTDGQTDANVSMAIGYDCGPVWCGPAVSTRAQQPSSAISYSSRCILGPPEDFH